MKWNKPNVIPSDSNEIILHIEIKGSHMDGERHFVIGEYYKGEYIINEPPTHDYPANYFEGDYVLLGWMGFDKPKI